MSHVVAFRFRSSTEGRFSRLALIHVDLGFPEIGLPPNHPLLDEIFHIINHPFGGTPLMQTPICQASDSEELPSIGDLGDGLVGESRDMLHGTHTHTHIRIIILSYIRLYT